MKKVIITGATGMIGRTLIEYLLNKNICVLAIIRKDSKKKNTLPVSRNLKTIECNLDELETLDIKDETYDVFLHLAWDRNIWDF